MTGTIFALYLAFGAIANFWMAARRVGTVSFTEHNIPLYAFVGVLMLPAWPLSLFFHVLVFISAKEVSRRAEEKELLKAAEEYMREESVL